jgi:uncharacterized protein (DUF433 family)
MNYGGRITMEAGKRGGKPCIRGLRITVYEVLEYLASGMSQEEILNDFPDLEAEDIRACLNFAADRERKLFAPAWNYSIPDERIGWFSGWTRQEYALFSALSRYVQSSSCNRRHQGYLITFFEFVVFAQKANVFIVDVNVQKPANVALLVSQVGLEIREAAAERIQQTS